MTDGLEGKRALVVGASRGMGRRVAERFGREGAQVAVAARSEEALEGVADGIEGNALAVPCDVREGESVDRAIERVAGELGGLDAVVNSAGAIARGPLHEAEDADIEAVVDVNLVGAMRVSRAVLPHLRASSGALIHVSSEAGERGIPGLPAYCASKGGLNALVRQLAVEYGPDGVSVTAIAPGTTKTTMNETVREEDPEWVEERRSGVPLDRLGEPADVGDLAAFLASDRADYVTGEVVHLDGGTTAK